MPKVGRFSNNSSEIQGEEDTSEIQLTRDLYSDETVLSFNTTSFQTPEFKIGLPPFSSDLAFTNSFGQRQAVFENGGVNRLEGEGTAITGAQLQINCPTIIIGSSNPYFLPSDKSGASNGDVLVLNGSSSLQFQMPPPQFSCGFGGIFAQVGDLGVVMGDPNLNCGNLLGSDTQVTLPHDGVIRKLSYSTATGDNTTELQILVNGAVTGSFTLSGSSGVHQPNLLVSEGDRVGISYSAGTSLGSSNIFMCIC